MTVQGGQLQRTRRYGQLHVLWVLLQTLDEHIQETHFVEHRQRLAAAFTGGTTQHKTDDD